MTSRKTEVLSSHMVQHAHYNRNGVGRYGDGLAAQARAFFSSKGRGHGRGPVLADRRSQEKAPCEVSEKMGCTARAPSARNLKGLPAADEL